MSTIKSLADKAILIGCNISCFTGAKKDKKATVEVAKDNNIQSSENNVRVWKTLMKGTQLSKVINASQKIRIELYKQTAPWNQSFRICKIAKLTDVKMELAKLIREFDAAVIEAVAAYDDMVNDDKVKLGDLFRADDYPSKSSFASSFSAKIIVQPVERNDFRSDILSPEDLEDINKQIEERVNTFSKEVEKDLLARVSEKLGHLFSRLTSDGKFHDSNLDNIIEVIGEVKNLNITENSKLNDVFDGVLTSVLQLSPDRIRGSKTARNKAIDEVKKNIDQISDAMSEFVV